MKGFVLENEGKRVRPLSEIFKGAEDRVKLKELINQLSLTGVQAAIVALKNILDVENTQENKL